MTCITKWSVIVLVSYFSLKRWKHQQFCIFEWVFKKKHMSKERKKLDLCLNVIMYEFTSMLLFDLKASYSVPSLAISSSQIFVSSSISWFCERQSEKQFLDVGVEAKMTEQKHNSVQEQWQTLHLYTDEKCFSVAEESMCSPTKHFQVVEHLNTTLYFNIFHITLYF